MKKLAILVAAIALTLGLAQCKKEQTPSNTGETVFITLNVDGGNDGTKVNVDPTGANQVTFTNGDQILVASGGKYVGTLTRTDGTFSGSISDPVEGQRLYFYFLGNKQGTLETGATTCTVNISDQTTTTGLPVISMGKSTVDYSSTVTAYSSRLYNKASLMKFVVTTPSTAAICITGMNNEVTVDFADPTDAGFTYGMNATDGGLIKMPGVTTENTTTWAIVLPQDALEAGAEGSAYTADEAYTGIRPEIEEIVMNTFINVGKALTLTTAAVTAPTGAINGLFTINADGDQVYFSQGNLRYIGSAATPYWKFADNQWECLGNNGQGSTSTTADRDLFGWGTSGWNSGANAYMPYSTSTINSDYYPGGSYNNPLTGDYAEADWAWHNAISNGGNATNRWRTLTSAEWAWLFNSRTNASSKWGHGKVNNINGMIILPDSWTLPDGLTFTSGSSSWSNVYTLAQWAQMEAAGAVFLPAAGIRWGTSVFDVGGYGGYWSSTHYDSSNAYGVFFDSGGLYAADYGNRLSGFAVRPVQVAD